MKKKLICSCILFLLTSSLFAQFDALLQVYCPYSLFGFNAGQNNSAFLNNTNSTYSSESFSLSVETRFKMFNIGRMVFSGSAMFTPFWSNLKNGYQTFNFSTGVGVNYNFFKKNQRDLAGLSIYVYPLMYFPLYESQRDISPRWKSAFEVGYTAIFFQYLSIHVFERNIIVWDFNKFKFLPDFGFSIGFNFPIDGKFPGKTKQ